MHAQKQITPAEVVSQAPLIHIKCFQILENSRSNYIYLQACVKFQKGFSQVYIHRIAWIKESVKIKRYINITVSTSLMHVRVNEKINSSLEEYIIVRR